MPSQRGSEWLKHTFHRPEDPPSVSTAAALTLPGGPEVLRELPTTLEAPEDRRQVGVFTQVNLVEQQLQK